VVHRYEVPLVIEAREVRPDGARAAARFDSRQRFRREDVAPPATRGDVLLDEAAFRLRGRFVDHDIPCLAYALEETARVRLAKDRIEAEGLGVGPWLRELKHAILAGADPSAAIEVRWRDRDGSHAVTRTVAALRHLVLDVVPGRRVGYVTDLRFTPGNVDALAGLLDGVDELFIECVFLDEDRAHGERKNHLTARQAGEIAARLRARNVVPFHFSPRYEGRAEALVAEMRAAWGGPAGRLE
jgi:ribonuclease Z